MSSRADRGKLQKYSRLSRNQGPPSVKRRRVSFSRMDGLDLEGSATKKDRTGPFTILSIPPELLDQIIAALSVKDVVMLGQTCRYLNHLCSNESVWKRIGRQLAPRLSAGSTAKDRFWKWASVINYTKGLYFQTFGGRRKSVSRAVAPHLSHGYRKFIPTKDNVFILDYNGTLFFLKNALVSSSLGQIQWKRACRYNVLCRNVKDFATDPRNDTIYRKYLYVLGMRDIPSLVTPDLSDVGHTCDCVEVYVQSSGQRVFKMTFHSSMSFKEIKLVGQETERSLLLLTDDGKVYSLTINETQLDQPRSYTVQLSTRKITKCLPHLTIAKIHSNQSSALYITDSGAIYLELHTAGVYRDLFGTLHAFDPFDQHIPLALALSSKVISCSLGYNHLGLVDEFGRIFMQGNNRYGQLGTGDKIDRGELTLVSYLKQPVDIWCGLNHSLVLSQAADFSKEVHGCGCGAGGRLPGFPKGSAFFVKLYVQVPHCTKKLCSTRECLYMLTCYDISEVLEFRELPCTKARSQGAESEVEGSRMCARYLSQLENCSSLGQQMEKMKDIVGQLGLAGYQKDFLQEAISTLQRSTVGQQP
ncbi:F-box only protein 24-like [Narcine bancroftii]|uniref:F-box only protein 24-like n=1 Tax=Narcine bancroftii TaxID=1343680 RepID=UPI0038312EE3